MTLERGVIATPVGALTLFAREDALVCVGLPHDPAAGGARHDAWLARHIGAHEVRESADPAGAVTRLAQYFAGDASALDTQPVALLGTPFQQRVWQALRTIAPGTTTTYSALAQALGDPRAVRAVAAANGANPLPLFVPCHRVIAADGTLWGYAGGLPMKAWLLRHEGAAFRPLADQGRLAL